MRKYTLQVCPDAEHASRAAAEVVVAVAREAIADRDRFTLVLSGGSTPRRLYQILAEPPLRDQVNWSKVEFFWGDERPVPPTSPDSNFRMAREALLGPLGIADAQIHRLPAERANLDAAAQEYQMEIARVLDTSFLSEPPQFDLVLLGVGPDGHTVSLFPATPALKETHQWVVRNPVLKLRSDRLTMTPMLLNRAACIVFLVTGYEKADILTEILEGPIDTQRLPAQIVRPPKGRVQWFLDEAAASKLRRK